MERELLPPPPSFRVRPAGTMPDRQDADGSVWRVHVFHIVTDEGGVLTEETPDGPRPIVLTSLPMLVSAPSPKPVMPRLVVPGREIIH